MQCWESPMAEIETIAKVLKEIQAAYPAWKADADTIKVWTVYMSDLPDEVLVNAVRNFISTSTHAFPPSIPEIRQSAAKLVAMVVGIPTPAEAWDEVRRAKKPNPPGYIYISGGEIVQDKPHQWSHKQVEICARRFGWPKFPNGENDVADRAHFTKAYEAQIEEQNGNVARLTQVNHFIEDKQEQRRAMLERGETDSVFDTGEKLAQLAAGMTRR